MKSGFYLLLTFVVFAILFLSGCVEKKECEKAADCAARTCLSAECRNGQCSYSPLPNCCGNEKCEVGETYISCADDCPNCDDLNKCTMDSYDYHGQKCANTAIPNQICCGNKLCETGESYEACAQDCPNCDDRNACTIDSFDYYNNKCLNEPIIPCCGNKICDQQNETGLTCEKDCPSCDDENRLTEDRFNYETQKCENVIEYYFIEDFEGGTSAWGLNDDRGNPDPSRWSISKEDGNSVLKGRQHSWALLVLKSWEDYIFRAKFKLTAGSVHFVYRSNWEEQGVRRYYVGVHSGGIYLSKEIHGGHIQIEQKNLPIGTDWHTIEIRGYGNIINVYLDDQLLIKYRDASLPILSGGVAFEPLDDAELFVDDVEIKPLEKEDVTAP